MNRAASIICTVSLGLCAAAVVRRQRPRVVSITGTVGKTTTTELTGEMLAHAHHCGRLGPVRKTPDNMNNTIGVALVILGYDRYPIGKAWLTVLRQLLPRTFRLMRDATYPRVLVLECGAGFGSNMRLMARIAPPHVSVVTNVGPAHLERFGSVAGVAREKGHLVRATRRGGLVVLGEENAYVDRMRRSSRARVVVVGGRGRELSRVVAREIGAFFGFPDALVEDGIAACGPLAGRLRTIHAGPITIIDDAFNANPVSVKYGLDALAAEAPAVRRRVAVLGAMGELGEAAERLHQQVGEYARRSADIVIGVGDLARHYGFDRWFADAGACADGLAEILRPGDLVLVKGSHSVHLDRVVEALTRTYGTSES